MKPSNTGRDWYSELRLWEVDAETDRYVGENAINLIAEAAAQIAIAEYRKELAAKVQRLQHTGLYAEYVKSEDVLSLLNENDE